MEEKEPDTHSDFFVVSDAGSEEVNGVYKNLDGNSNDNTLNYKMTNREGRTFKLYRSPSEDQSVRYWIIEERHQDYYYLAFSDKKTPPETDWTPYVRGQARPPEVTKVSREVEYELRKRIEHHDSLTTLDLIDQYGKFCETPALKRLYRVLWNEQTPETQQAIKEAAGQSKSKGKKKKRPTIKHRIAIMVQLGVGSSEQTAAQKFEIMVDADTAVRHLKTSISKELGNGPGKGLELMFNGHKILSRETPIDKLGIEKGSIIIALGVKREMNRKNPAGSPSGIRKSALPPLDEAEDQPVSEPDQGSKLPNSTDIDVALKRKKSCAVQ